MAKSVEYGTAVAVMQLNGKLKEDWQHRDPDADLQGTTCRLIVRDIDHAKALAESCAKIWADYEQENLLRGKKRGRKPGSGFKKLLEELNKVLEAEPEPKEYTSSEVAAELEERLQENKEARQEIEQAKEKRRRRPKGTLEAWKQESHQNFGDINLRIPLTVDYGEWTSGECAFTIRFGGQIAMSGDGDTRDEAWDDLCQNVAAKMDALIEKADAGDDSDTGRATDEHDDCWLWLNGMVEEDQMPECFRQSEAVEN